MTRIVNRACSPADETALIRHGLHPILARLYAARGVRLPDEIETDGGHIFSGDEAVLLMLYRFRSTAALLLGLGRCWCAELLLPGPPTRLPGRRYSRSLKPRA